MDDLSNKRVLIFDEGGYCDLASRLARDFGSVQYFSPWKKSSPQSVQLMIGDGFDGIERVRDFWDAVPGADLIVFPDCYRGDMQVYLEGQGKRVWGSRKAERFEFMREVFKKTLKQVGLPISPYKVIVGISKLREYLSEHDDQIVKVSLCRGDTETFDCPSYALRKSKIDALEFNYGPAAEHVRFVVEDKIDTLIEVGYDGICIDGQYTDGFVDYETKNRCCLIAMRKYEDMAEPVREINEKFSSVLKDERYRSCFGTEIRVDKAGTPFFIDATCFSSDTDVLTNHGWKAFPDLLKDDLVCTLNPNSGQIEHQLPQAYVGYRYSGEMISISSPKKALDMLVTPNHSVWGRKPSGKLIECRADEIPAKLSIPRTGTWGGVECDSYTVPEYNHSWSSGRCGRIKKEYRSEKKVILMDDWLRFLGIFLSEGHVHKNGYQVVITQTKYVDAFKKIIGSLPFKTHRHKKGITIDSVQLAEHLSNTGNRNQRGIPDYVKCLSPRQINIFLDAYCLGDGQRVNGSRVISTTSTRTAGDIQELFLKAGSVGNIRVVRKSGLPVMISHGKYFSKHDALKVVERLERQDFWIEGWSGNRHKKYLKRVPYDGMVYDVTVPNHIVYVRRNGKPCWSGNCRTSQPPGEALWEMFSNLSEIMWYGSNGDFVQVKPAAKYACEIMLYMNWQDRSWQEIHIPDDARQWIKLCTAAKVDGLYYPIACEGYERLPWGEEEFGAAIGIGDTLEEAIDAAKDHAESVGGFNISYDVSSIAESLVSAKAGEKEGVEFAKEIPNPETVIESE